jgi:hypothetical protein
VALLTQPGMEQLIKKVKINKTKKTTKTPTPKTARKVSQTTKGVL